MARSEKNFGKKTMTVRKKIFLKKLHQKICQTVATAEISQSVTPNTELTAEYRSPD